MNFVLIQLTRFYQVLHFGDCHLPCGGHDRVKIARGFPEDQITLRVTHIRFDNSNVSNEPRLHHVIFSIKCPGFLAISDLCAKTCFCEKRWYAGPASTNTFCKRPLRVELQLQFPIKVLLLKGFIFAHIRGDHFFNLPSL